VVHTPVPAVAASSPAFAGTVVVVGRRHRRCHRASGVIVAAHLWAPSSSSRRTIVVVTVAVPCAIVVALCAVVVIGSPSRAINIARLCTTPGLCSPVDGGRGGCVGCGPIISPWRCRVFTVVAWPGRVNVARFCATLGLSLVDGGSVVCSGCPLEVVVVVVAQRRGR
jgi:hypothetical protein